jgi:Domain of unknown function (DUF222)/HNH endonuclease
VCTSDGRSGVDLLQAGLGVLDRADVAGMPDPALRSEVQALLVAVNRLHAAVAARLAVFDARGLAQDDGFRSTKGWLGGFARLSGGAASALVKGARLLWGPPALAAAAGRGEVPAEQLGRVVRLAERVGPGVLADVDEVLAAAAATLNPDDLDRVCQRVRAHADPDGPEPDPAVDFDRRGIILSRFDHMILVRGQLDPEGGAALLTALDALMKPAGPADTRTTGQRRADALVQLARQALAGGRLPTVGGVRPQLGILITPQTLTHVDTHRQRPGRAVRWLTGPTGATHDPNPDCPPGMATNPAQVTPPEQVTPPGQTALPEQVTPPGQAAPPGQVTPSRKAVSAPARGDPLAELGIPARPEPAWLDWVGQIPAALAQRIACDADVWRIVLDPTTGLPLDVGRSQRLVPHWIRSALHARDRGCRWPGCQAPTPWTDAHHLHSWTLGGKTSIENLLLLCRWHHSLIHEGQWHLRYNPATGQVHITRPEALPYQIPATTPWTTPATRQGDPPQPEAA